MFTTIKSLLRVSNILFAIVLILSFLIIYILTTYKIEEIASVSGYIDGDRNYTFQYDPNVLPDIDLNTNVTITLPETTVTSAIFYIDTTANYAICALSTDQSLFPGNPLKATISTSNSRSLGAMLISRYFK